GGGREAGGGRGATVARWAPWGRAVGARCWGWSGGGLPASVESSATVVGAVVLDAASAQPCLERLGKPGPGRLHAEQPGVAAARGNFETGEHRCVRGHVDVAHVRRPHPFAGPEPPAPIALPLDHPANHVHVRIT